MAFKLSLIGEGAAQGKPGKGYSAVKNLCSKNDLGCSRRSGGGWSWGMEVGGDLWAKTKKLVFSLSARGSCLEGLKQKNVVGKVSLGAASGEGSVL